MESFSQRVKNQICKAAETQVCCQQAFIFSVLYFSRGYNKDTVHFHTENKNIAELFVQILIELTGVSVSIYTPKEKDLNRILYSVTIDNPNEMEMVLEYLNEQKDNILKRVNKQNCCKKAFLTGAFLISGAVIDPTKDYHLELSLSNSKKCDLLLKVFNTLGIGMKSTSRRQEYILYTKGSQEIEDILTLMGATESTFELMNLKIEKEIRNNVNRITNCETANIDKTVKAAQLQINAINKLQKKDIELSDEILEVMEKRLANPIMSLSELAGLFSNNISKTTLNRRLQKIIKLSQE